MSASPDARPEPRPDARPDASAEALRATIRSRYAEAARQASSGARACCGPVSCCPPAENGADSEVQAQAKTQAPDPITKDLYLDGQTEGLPAEAVLASLGCGNPTALAALEAGETVLDLGSGGGIDVLLSARRVGPTGRAYGLDMTDEMLELARSNQQKAGISNAEFLKGEMEAIPLPDASVDVILSNCVINLAADKGQVLQEAFRVLRPGGRFAVSDIVVRGPVADDIRRSMELWIGCVAGALDESEYRRLLAEAGFTDIDIEPTRVYGREDARALLAMDAGTGAGADKAAVEAAADRFMSAFIRARRPA